MRESERGGEEMERREVGMCEVVERKIEVRGKLKDKNESTELRGGVEREGNISDMAPSLTMKCSFCFSQVCGDAISQ